MRVLQRVQSSGKSGLRFQNPDLQFAIYYEIQKTHFKAKKTVLRFPFFLLLLGNLE